MEHVQQEGNFPIKKVQDFSFFKTDKGNYYCEASLLLDVGGQEMLGSWQGFFTEKTKQITISTIKTLGVTTHDFQKLIELDASDCFICPDDIVAAVKAETSDDGKTYYKIRWINKPKRAKANKSDILEMVKKNNLSGLLFASMKRDSEDEPKKNEPEKTPETLDDILI